MPTLLCCPTTNNYPINPNHPNFPKHPNHPNNRLEAMCDVLRHTTGLPVQARLPLASVESHVQEILGNRPIFFPHRLDKHTSGVMVVAFSSSVAAEFGKAIKGQKLMKKQYRVLAQLPPCVVRANTDLSSGSHHNFDSLQSPALKGSLLVNEGGILAQTGVLESLMGRRAGGSTYGPPMNPLMDPLMEPPMNPLWTPYGPVTTDVDNGRGVVL
jgi:hypothetical protein